MTRKRKAALVPWPRAAGAAALGGAWVNCSNPHAFCQSITDSLGESISRRHPPTIEGQDDHMAVFYSMDTSWTNFTSPFTFSPQVRWMGGQW
jgi:hypothetical protein